MSTSAMAPRGRWTLHDLVHLEPPRWMESCDVEIVDGSLVVTPPPPLGHDRLGHRLFAQLAPQLARDQAVMMEVAVLIGADGDFRRPDLVVLRDEAELSDDQEAVPGPYVLVAVEVESPTTRRTDRIAKPREYAAEGVPAYWRIERDPALCLVAHVLVDGSYVETARSTAGVVRLGQWTVDVDALSRRGDRPAP